MVGSVSFFLFSCLNTVFVFELAHKSAAEAN